MANRRILVKRRKAVRNIRKITRTMQLIATARFQAAFNRAVAARPYTEKLAELVADVSRALEAQGGAGGEAAHPLMRARPEAREGALLVLTSTRGLCGGYNSNVLRAAIGHLDQQKADGVEPSVHMVGKKGISYFRFLRRPVAKEDTSIGDAPRYEQVEPIARDFLARFLRGEIAFLDVAYMRFHSAGQQRPEVVRLLPLTAPTPPAPPKGERKHRAIEYEFMPDPKAILDDLLPATFRARLFQSFIDAAVSEQIARMVAMKAATDAAEDMIKMLTRQYNRARQTAITMELLDIVGGANALA